MTQYLRSASSARARRIGWTFLLAIAIAWSLTLSAAEKPLHQAPSACRGDAAVDSGQFEPIIHDVSTSTLLGSDRAEVRWVLSSEVSASGDPASEGRRFCYAYFFRNVGDTPIKVSLVSPQLALSPLFDIMQDFSVELNPGSTKVIRFLTPAAPELSLATAYNAARHENLRKWDFVSSRPITLYLPASLKAPYVQPASVEALPDAPHLR